MSRPEEQRGIGAGHEALPLRATVSAPAELARSLHPGTLPVSSPRSAPGAAELAGGEPRSEPPAKGCVVCWAVPRDTVLTACGHAVLCLACVGRLRAAEPQFKCPVCNTRVPPGAWALLATFAQAAPAGGALAPAQSYLPGAVDTLAASPSATLREPAQERVREALRAAVARAEGPDQGLLWNAAREGETDCVRALVARGTDVDAPRAEDGLTPLHLAARNGHASCVEALLQAGAEVAACDTDGLTPLHEAASFGHVECVRLLAAHPGVPLDGAAGEDKRTPLHYAASNGHTSCVEALLQAGAELAVCDKGGRTPLHEAALSGDVDCVRLLAAHPGAPLDCLTGESKSTALHYAASKGHASCVEVLLQASAAVAACDKDGWTPLHCAASFGHVECVRLLAAHPGVPLDGAAGEDKRTPLHMAALRGHVDCVRLLAAHPGAPPDCLTGEYKLTPLHYAASQGHASCVEALLQAGAKLAACDKGGRTPLHFAASFGHVECVRLLAAHPGAPLDDAAGEDKRTPLHYAASQGHANCVEALLQAGAEVAVCDTDGQTPLHYAASSGHASCVEALCRLVLQSRRATQMARRRCIVRQLTAMPAAWRRCCRLVLKWQRATKMAARRCTTQQCLATWSVCGFLLLIRAFRWMARRVKTSGRRCTSRRAVATPAAWRRCCRLVPNAALSPCSLR